MKKKVIVVVAALALIAICATCLVACNSYKWKSVGGGDPTAPVESNGGYVVKQGNYLYYINGYEGTDGDNTWGTPVKQSIVRSELNEDGSVNNATTTVVVPKFIYNSSAKGGFAIYGEWIYYATPNSDRDKNGVASTTDTDFMRTKIDGSVTQRITKIGTRSAEYLFTPTRILYYTSNTISYVDFTGMKTDKNIDNGSGASEGVLATNVSSVVWNMDCDTIFYTKTMTGEESYKNYNQLCSIKIDGSAQTVLATEGTFLGENEVAAQNPQKVFKYTLRDLYIESDKSVTLYYTKTYTLDSTDKNVGLFCAKANADTFKSSEKQLTLTNSTTLYPLGYEEGALAFNASSTYCWYNGQNLSNPVQVTDSSKTIWKVDAENGIAYFSSSSSAKELLKISYKTVDNAVIVISESIKTDWLRLDFVGDTLYFFASDDSNFMHSVNIKTFNKDEEDAKSAYVGFEREEDKDEEDK
ncbi:MAG: DUF5050 domain-containing protein [Clostridia bacterium]|nr:DUF5050 domain-containing protein [Clostridia bacterium]